LLTYDREVVKMDEPRIVAAAKKLYEKPPEVRVLVPTSQVEGQTWRVKRNKPGEGWQAADFNDSGWKSERGGFGNGQVRDAVKRSNWRTPDIWLRRSFELSQDDLDRAGQLMLNVLHDEDAEIYLNGELIRTLKGSIKSYQIKDVERDARKLLRPGKNVLAVHCRQTKGPQYIDLGIVEMVE